MPQQHRAAAAMGGSGNGRQWRWAAVAHELSLSLAAISVASAALSLLTLHLLFSRYPIKMLLLTKKSADTPTKFYFPLKIVTSHVDL